jgi:hypothetical protein
MVLISITIGVISNIVLGNGVPGRWSHSGWVGGAVGPFLLDWLFTWGPFLFVLSSFLVLIRGYFDLDYYGPFLIASAGWDIWRRDLSDWCDPVGPEGAARAHTPELGAVMDVLPGGDESPDDAYVVGLSGGHKAIVLGSTGDDDYSVDGVDPADTEQSSVESDDDLDSESILTAEPIGETNTNFVDENISSEELNIEEVIETEEVDIDQVAERKKPKRKYQLPSSDLLDDPVNISDNLSRDELVERASYLTQSMAPFGVEGKVVNVLPGPLIKVFEVAPAEGVRPK